MSNFKWIHFIAVIVALLCFLLGFPKCLEEFNSDWQRGTGFLIGVAFGGYMFGCVNGFLINLILDIYRKNKVFGIILLIPIGLFFVGIRLGGFSKELQLLLLIRII